MASAVDSRLAYARLSAVATASRLPTANRGSNNSYTTSWDTTLRHRTGVVFGYKYRKIFRLGPKHPSDIRFSDRPHERISVRERDKRLAAVEAARNQTRQIFRSRPCASGNGQRSAENQRLQRTEYFGLCSHRPRLPSHLTKTAWLGPPIPRLRHGLAVPLIDLCPHLGSIGPRLVCVFNVKNKLARLGFARSHETRLPPGQHFERLPGETALRDRQTR